MEGDVPGPADLACSIREGVEGARCQLLGGILTAHCECHVVGLEPPAQHQRDCLNPQQVQRCIFGMAKGITQCPSLFNGILVPRLEFGLEEEVTIC